MMNWHGSVGIWLTVALVFISLTGLTWSTFAGDRFDAVPHRPRCPHPEDDHHIRPGPGTGRPDRSLWARRRQRGGPPGCRVR